MKRTAKIAAVVSGGALAAGAFAVPALASGSGAGPANPPGQQQMIHRPVTGNGTGNGTGLQIRVQDGTCVNLPASGVLTAAQRAELVSLAENEKLAHDLYAQFAKVYGLRVFSNLAAAEASHLHALRMLMTRYGITDPTAGQAAGTFSTASVQASYDRLLATGRGGEHAALTVAQGLEQQAISRYGDALSGLTAPDATKVLQNLKTAEARHLAAVGNWNAQ
jgi:hypothetical protein